MKLKDYLTNSFRDIFRHKALSVINITGLAVGLASCMLIFLYIRDEISFDHFHKKIDQIYQLTCTRIEKDGKKEKFAIAAMVQGPAFKREIPDIQEFVRVKGNQLTTKINNDVFKENILWADDNFFSVFTFPLLSGNPKNVLSDIHSVVITEETAKKYFGNGDAVGKTFDVQVEGSYETFKVSGIAEDPPQNSTIKFKMVLPFNYLEEVHPDNGWHWVSFPTYFVLNPKSDYQAVTSKLEQVYQVQARSEIEEIKSMGYGTKTIWGLQPFSHMHLNTEFKGTPESSSPIYSYILSGIAVFILLIACINFINLSVAQTLTRNKEIGVRKVFGGQRIQLFRQFISESFSVCFIAFLFALILAELALPFFNELANKHLSLSYLFDLKLVIGFMGLFLFTGFAAGFYPALILSGYTPTKTLNNPLKYSGRNWLSKSLVVIQFSLATFLIIFTLIICTQFNYLTKKDLGYNDKNLLEVTVGKAIFNKSLTRILKTEILRIPGVEMVAPKNIGHFGGPTKADGKEFLATYEHVDEDFVPTLHISVDAGRNFSKDFPADSINSVLVNQTFVKQAGWSEPIGKTIDHMNIPGWGDRRITVVGVVKDYNSESLKERIKPEVLTYEPKLPLGKFLIRVNDGRIPETVKLLEGLILKMVPSDPFQYSFVEQLNRDYYKKENKWKQIITVAACLAIFISCIGLFALTTLTTKRRTKEIGIRKVLGASVNQIINLIFHDFIKYISISFVIAIPLALYSVRLWLQNFAYRIEITLWIFLFAGLLAILIAALTISIQAVKAALANPVESLINE